MINALRNSYVGYRRRGGFGPVLNVSNCVNVSYDDFSNASPSSLNAAWTTSGSQYAGTADEIPYVSGETYLVEFNMVLNSGIAPWLALSTTYSSNIMVGGIFRAVAGVNSWEITVNTTTTGVLYFLNTVAGNFEITNLSIRHIL